MRKQKAIALVLVFAVGAAMSWVWAPTAEEPAPLMRTAARQGNPPLTAPMASGPARRASDEARSVSDRLDDLTLEAHVAEALYEARSLRAVVVTPYVRAGQVELRGDVATPEQYDEAARVVRSVEGVRGVTNALTIDGETVAQARQKAERAPQDDDESSSASDGPSYHVVRNGESLWTIARRNGLSVDRLKALNGLRTDRVKPGERLRVR